MWHELLIPSGLMLFFFNMPTILVPWWHEYWYNNRWHPKDLEDEVIRQCHFRDLLRSGDPWTPFGVEHIPDEIPAAFK